MENKLIEINLVRKGINMILPFELGPIRPVAEANSLIIRVTRGCPWNRCAFCTSYKSKEINFSKRSVDEIKKILIKYIKFIKNIILSVAFYKMEIFFAFLRKI